ncbi:MAG: hypothetical protein JSS68_15070 [Actinobacteria bacterium]|nr:hypothetical protein [Actinomycetota bacterium]
MAATTKTVKDTGLFKDFSITEVTFSNSYTSGGETFTPAQANLQSIDHYLIQMLTGSESSTYRPTSASYSEGKIHLLDSATGKEVESGKDMSKVKVLFWAFGKSRAH